MIELNVSGLMDSEEMAWFKMEKRMGNYPKPVPLTPNP
jgi:hypothetical protein